MDTTLVVREGQRCISRHRSMVGAVQVVGRHSQLHHGHDADVNLTHEHDTRKIRTRQDWDGRNTEMMWRRHEVDRVFLVGHFNLSQTTDTDEFEQGSRGGGVCLV